MNKLRTIYTRFGWADAMVLAHNTMFDGAILSWLFDIRPRVWADTLCIGSCSSWGGSWRQSRRRWPNDTVSALKVPRF